MTPRNHGPAKNLDTTIRLDSSRSTLSILVVDDDSDFLELICRQIAKISGAQIYIANGRDEAVELLVHKDFDLVVCDWALSSHTAPEVFHLADPRIDLFLKNRKIPVMFMSGSDKVGPVLNLRNLKNFEPVTFILKAMGAHMIRVMAEGIIDRFRKPMPRTEQAYFS